jgi:histidyl-tRNA synthetase
LRVFDTKNPAVERALADAPKITDSLCPECRQHFDEVRGFLDAYGVAYELEPTLVRGLDYYTRTVWEFVNDALGAAQSSICAGGRYDYLIEEIGGRPTPGVGWAAGLERLAMSSGLDAGPPRVDVFVAFEDGARRRDLFPVLARLRSDGRACETDYAGRSLKGQLTHAARLGAETVIIASGDRLRVRRRGREDVDVQTIDEALALL